MALQEFDWDSVLQRLDEKILIQFLRTVFQLSSSHPHIVEAFGNKIVHSLCGMIQPSNAHVEEALFLLLSTCLLIENQVKIVDAH